MAGKHSIKAVDYESVPESRSTVRLLTRRPGKYPGRSRNGAIARLESADDYRAFETAVINEYAPKSLVERELVTRLAGLLWRLRRAAAIETGLFEIQARILEERRAEPDSAQRAFRQVNAAFPTSAKAFSDSKQYSSTSPESEIACCFLRLINLENGVIAHLGRYEARNWRQAQETISLLHIFRTST